MDHYDLDYEMAIAFRAEILARLDKHIQRIKREHKNKSVSSHHRKEEGDASPMS